MKLKKKNIFVRIALFTLKLFNFRLCHLIVESNWLILNRNRVRCKKKRNKQTIKTLFSVKRTVSASKSLNASFWSSYKCSKHLFLRCFFLSIYKQLFSIVFKCDKIVNGMIRFVPVNLNYCNTQFMWNTLVHGCHLLIFSVN